MHAAAESGQIGALLLMIEAGAFIDEQVCSCVSIVSMHACVCVFVCVFMCEYACVCVLLGPVTTMTEQVPINAFSIMSIDVYMYTQSTCVYVCTG
jgi:hypothetical protein